MSEATVATSSPEGTVLPRSGVFWGVQAPQLHSTVVIGEYPSYSVDQTPVRAWFESHEHLAEQTNIIRFRAGLLRLESSMIDLDAISAANYKDLSSYRPLTGSSWLTVVPSFVRGVDVACAFVSKRDDSTESPWLRLRGEVAPLFASSKAILEVISTELEQEKSNSGQSRHAGLSAVALLAKLLGLSRPTILRMAGVPESTFYAWQKNPRSIVRTPSVARLLRLQAHVGLLVEVLGQKGLQSWLLASDRINRLQGDDATFAETLAEAEETLTGFTRVTQRRRMRPEDYDLDPEQPGDDMVRKFPGRLRASKLTDELAE